MHKEGNDRFKGSCFVTYADREHAFNAIKNLNVRHVFPDSDKPMEVRFADTRKKGFFIPPMMQMPMPMMVSETYKHQIEQPQYNFIEYYTPEGKAYYYNVHTQTTQWDRPNDPYIMPA
jgi:CUG-BP- and ETR3-like factor